MIIRFDRKQFEKVLPTVGNGLLKKPLWKFAGEKDGELCYTMSVPNDLIIQIRSSIRTDGRAAPKGEDSIRAWLTSADGNPIGSKIQSYVTRVKGWDVRLLNVLRELWRRANSLEACPDCGKLMGIYKVRKEGQNKGRLFTRCFDHGHFTWQDTAKKIERRAQC